MINKDSLILVVDDMKMARFLIIKGITDMGFTHYKEAADGEEAWALLNDPALNFSMILSDWNMPKMNGLELLIKLRATDKFQEIPFIMITAESEPAQTLNALKSGATDYMLKPFATEVLRQKMEKHAILGS